MRRSATTWLQNYALAWALVLAMVSGCGGGGEEDTGDDAAPTTPDPIVNTPLPPATALNCPKGTELTYENFGEAFLLNYCTSCHSQHLPEGQRAGAPLEANFDTSANASLWRANILTAAGADNAPMPPGGGVPLLERIQLIEWLSCGAPQGEDHLE